MLENYKPEKNVQENSLMPKLTENKPLILLNMFKEFPSPVGSRHQNKVQVKLVHGNYPDW